MESGIVFLLLHSFSSVLWIAAVSAGHAPQIRSNSAAQWTPPDTGSAVWTSSTAPMLRRAGVAASLSTSQTESFSERFYKSEIVELSVYNSLCENITSLYTKLQERVFYNLLIDQVNCFNSEVFWVIQRFPLFFFGSQ